MKQEALFDEKPVQQSTFAEREKNTDTGGVFDLILGAITEGLNTANFKHGYMSMIKSANGAELHIVSNKALCEIGVEFNKADPDLIRRISSVYTPVTIDVEGKTCSLKVEKSELVGEYGISNQNAARVGFNLLQKVTPLIPTKPFKMNKTGCKEIRKLVTNSVSNYLEERKARGIDLTPPPRRGYYDATA